MVSVSTIVCVSISLLVSLVLSVILVLLFARKHRKQGIVSAWLLGATGFFVTQVMIRIPVLMVLQEQPWFLDFSQNHLFAYAFSLAFTAGLFELAGRFTVAKLMRRRLNYRRSLAAGLGHGGIEAMLLIGMTYVNNLLYIVMINSGYFDSLIAQTAGLGVDISQLELIRAQLTGASPALFLLGGFERILAMTAHAAMSMLVCYGVAHKKVRSCTLVCLGIHTFIDLTAGLSLVLPQNIAYPIIYAILIAVAAVSGLILKRIYRSWKEVSHDSEE
jgi:uncharacterized membrane protein YhfC